MKVLRKVLVGAALALGFVGVVAQSDTAVAKKPFQNQQRILAYRNAFKKTQRFIIFNGGRIFSFLDDPLTQRGTIDFVFFNGDDPIDPSFTQYQATINGTKVRITRVTP